MGGLEEEVGTVGDVVVDEDARGLFDELADVEGGLLVIVEALDVEEEGVALLDGSEAVGFLLEAPDDGDDVRQQHPLVEVHHLLFFVVHVLVSVVDESQVLQIRPCFPSIIQQTSKRSTLSVFFVW